MTVEPSAPPRVSVCLPAYNGSAFLDETLESLLTQSFEDFEVVAVDDASTDDTWERLKRWANADPRVRVERNEHNRGHRATSNRCFALARGGYLARTDQDDLSFPDRLERQVRFLDTNPRVGALATGYLPQYPDGRRGTPRRPPSHPDVIRWKLLFGMPFCHSSLMLRRSAFGRRGPYYGYAPAAYDYEVCVRLARISRIAALPASLVVYRLHDTGLSTRGRTAMERSATALSNRQLRSLLQRRRPGREELAGLRRLGQARDVRREDLRLAPLFLELHRAFRTLPDVDPQALEAHRHTWGRKLLRRLPRSAVPGLLRSPLLPLALRGQIGPGLAALGRGLVRPVAVSPLPGLPGAEAV